jgi:hypothetical protein
VDKGHLLITQAERDRLTALKKAQKKLITQKQAAEEIGVTERQVRRLLVKLRRMGDKAVIHALRGRPSNQRFSPATEEQAMAILCGPLYQGFGPTLAAEYLRKNHNLPVSKETLRQWMVRAGLWKAGRQSRIEAHQWRLRRSRLGELIQWDTSEHDWLEGRGEKIYLISMNRRCHQPAVCPLRAARLDGREHARAVGVSGTFWPPACVLHGQSGLVSDSPEDQAG